MADIPATYAGAWMRWALYLHDHPQAAEPTFQVTTCDDPRVNVPEEFSNVVDGNGEIHPTAYVVCTLDPCDGSRAETAWKDIPHTERRDGKNVPFARTPENWRKVSAGALGRALKEAGYPDDTRELHAVVTWRRRDIELQALAAGATIPALTEAPKAEDVAQAGRADATDEHPDADQSGSDEAEVVGEVVAWASDAAGSLRPVFDALDREAQNQVRGFCESRNLGPYWLLTNGPLRKVVSFARSLAPKTPAVRSAETAPNADDPHRPTDSPPEAPQAPESALSGQSGDPGAVCDLCDQVIDGIPAEGDLIGSKLHPACADELQALKAGTAVETVGAVMEARAAKIGAKAK